jgi:hypothetical protein
MRRTSLVSVFLASMLVFAPVARAQAIVVGTGIADAAGSGALDINVDPASDPKFVADELKANLQLSNGATIQSISVQNGVAHIEFDSALAGGTIEATMPTEVASSIGASAVGGAGGGTSVAAIIGSGVIIAAGGALGGCAAAGCFDNEETPVVTDFQ